MKLGNAIKMGNIFNKRRGFERVALEVLVRDIFVMEEGHEKVLQKCNEIPKVYGSFFRLAHRYLRS